MPICLATSAYCIPPAYERVIEPGGILKRVNRDGSDFTISPNDFQTAGAKINLMSSDNIVAVSISGFKSINLKDGILFYKGMCSDLVCTFFTSHVGDLSNQRFETRREIYVHALRVEGASNLGLQHALQEITVKVDPSPERIPLRTLVPEAVVLP